MRKQTVKKPQPNLFAWSVLRAQWFYVGRNALNRPVFIETTASKMTRDDVAICMPSGAISRPTSGVSPHA